MLYKKSTAWQKVWLVWPDVLPDAIKQQLQTWVHCVKVHHLNYWATFGLWNTLSNIYEPYLTLPYLTRKPCYRLALRPPVGPMRIPELTLSLLKPLRVFSRLQEWALILLSTRKTFVFLSDTYSEVIELSQHLFVIVPAVVQLVPHILKRR